MLREAAGSAGELNGRRMLAEMSGWRLAGRDEGRWGAGGEE